MYLYRVRWPAFPLQCPRASPCRADRVTKDSSDRKWGTQQPSWGLPARRPTQCSYWRLGRIATEGALAPDGAVCAGDPAMSELMSACLRLVLFSGVPPRRFIAQSQ